jgi:hypothetical protein
MKLLTLSAVALMLLFAACGKSDSSSSNAKNAEAAVPFDCDSFEKRVYECSAEFTATYGGTKFAERIQGDTPADKAATILKVLNMVKNIDGQSACNMPAWGNLAEKDPKWQVRYNKCKADTPCAEWGKCIGEALGTPMTY